MTTGTPKLTVEVEMPVRIVSGGGADWSDPLGPELPAAVELTERP